MRLQNLFFLVQIKTYISNFQMGYWAYLKFYEQTYFMYILFLVVAI
jgi:hypothetical protein